MDETYYCDKKNNKFEGEIMTIKLMKNQNE